MDWSVVCLNRRGSSGQQSAEFRQNLIVMSLSQRQHAEVVMRSFCLIQQPCKALESKPLLPAPRLLCAYYV